MEPCKIRAASRSLWPKFLQERLGNKKAGTGGIIGKQTQGKGGNVLGPQKDYARSGNEVPEEAVEKNAKRNQFQGKA